MKNSQSGSVVLMAIFLVFFISVLMISLELLRLSDLEVITNHIKDMEAYYCAEAGIEYYIYRSRRPGFFPAANAATAINEAAPSACITGSTRTYQVYFTTTKADPNIRFYHKIHITSTGTTSGYSRRVHANMRRNWIAPSVGSTDFIQINDWREL